MKIVTPSIEITFFVPESGESIEQTIEKAGRTCYKSEDKITDDSSEKFVNMLRERGHDAMLEFGYAMARIVADRGCSHELVRHRPPSYAQESTRYCNYGKGKFNKEITILDQPEMPIGPALIVWENASRQAEQHYMTLLDYGVKPEIARSILPIGLKTEIVISTNMREWRHIFELRCSKAAHPTIRNIMLEALNVFYKKVPSLFSDLAEKYLESRVW